MLRSLERWQVIDAWPGSRLLAGQNRGGRFTVGVADLERSGVTVLGRTDGWFSSAMCRAAGRYVGCGGGTELAVWRLPGGMRIEGR